MHRAGLVALAVLLATSASQPTFAMVAGGTGTPAPAVPAVPIVPPPPPPEPPTPAIRLGPTGPAPSGGYPYHVAFDPIVATHPTHADRVAVSYHLYRRTADRCGTPALGSGLRISRDAGRTWREARGLPWAGSGRVPNWHATIAWGPGPRPGRARLYWADTTLSRCDFGDHRLSIAWSDDEGDTWSRMFVLRSVPSTANGGYPDITVDRDPASPNHGVVYAAINWFASEASEPGFRLLASRDFGRTWDGAEVPPVAGPRGYPFAYRIGYRLRTAPDGALYAVWHQSDTTDSSRRAYGRFGWGISRIVYDRRERRFRVRRPAALAPTTINGVTLGVQPAPGTTDTLRLRPRWTIGLDVDPMTGRVLVALPDFDLSPPSGRARGVVRVGRSDDRGRSWRWTRVPGLPRVDGRRQSPHKPSLAIAGGIVVVGVHGIVDVPVGTSPRRGAATIGTAVAVSVDGGITFGEPTIVGAGRWDPEALARHPNRAGLRDRMEAAADGRLFWAFADGRTADPAPSPTDGRSRIMVARIAVPDAP
jgi:hypothetical protein